MSLAFSDLRHNAPVTYTLLIVNVLIYGGMVFLFHTVRFSPLMLYSAGGGWSDGSLYEEPWRLITSAFIHLTPAHLLSNMFTLCVWGKRTEYRFGVLSFLAVYFACAVFSAVCSQIWLHNTVYVGASGAIAGVLGLMVALATAGDPTIRGSEIVSNIILNTALAYFFPVNWIAHLSGLTCGALLGWLLLFLQAPLPWKRASTSFESSCVCTRPTSFGDVLTAKEEVVTADALYDRLVKLADLRDKDILSEEEFSQQKAHLLKE